jgi:hypothetical protein
MLKILSHSTMDRWISWYHTSITRYVYNSTVQLKPYYYDCAYATETTKPSEAIVRGHIVTGPLSQYDERPCSHHGIKGTIHLDEAVSKDPNTTSFNNTILVHGRKVVAALSVGDKYDSGPEYFYERNRTTKSSFRFIAMCTSTHVFFGYLRFNHAGNRSGYVSVRRIQASTGRVGPEVTAGLTDYASVEQFSIGAFGLLTLPWGSSYTTMNILGFRQPSAPLESVSRHIQMLNKTPPESFSYLFTNEKAMYGELAKKAVDSIRFVQTNGLQFILELRNGRKLFSSIFKGAKSSRAAASAYLAYQYGAMSNLRDIESYRRGVRNALKMTKQSYRAVRSGVSFQEQQGSTVTMHYKVFYSYYDNDMLSALRLLDQWALLPNMKMAWDFVPFSFVFDWFLSVESFLDKLDFRTRYQMYKVLAVTRSTKVELPLLPESTWLPFKFSGDATFVTYRREIRKKLDLPVLNFDTPDEFNNIVELTALLVANR